VIYRHFATRDELVDALVVRVAQRYISAVIARLANIAEVADIVVESMVIIATEIALDPILAVISGRTDEASVADLIVGSPQLGGMLTGLYYGVFALVPPVICELDCDPAMRRAMYSPRR
jgi:AcrR family transcriptional regulator